jgi:hypothetical protein
MADRRYYGMFIEYLLHNDPHLAEKFNNGFEINYGETDGIYKLKIDNEFTDYTSEDAERLMGKFDQFKKAEGVGHQVQNL